jgi:hypothetical protein
VVPPSPPPVNPAPPSGSAARKEAKQRQAATAKSEEGASEKAAEHTAALGGDAAAGPPSAMPATARDARRPLQFAAVRVAHQPSAWSRELLYAGSLTLAALILALGFTGVRPGPRRREPHLPAPAWRRLH